MRLETSSSFTPGRPEGLHYVVRPFHEGTKNMFRVFVMAVSVRLSSHKRFQHKPLRIALRIPVLATAMVEVAACFFLERMKKQPAPGATGGHALNRLEVLARVVVSPRRAAGRERLQAERRPAAVARDAARVARPLRQEDRLHF